MKHYGTCICLLVMLMSVAFGQDSTSSDSRTASQNIALYTMTGIIVPLALAGTVISVFPPSGGVYVRDGAAFGTFSIETGYGDGGRMQTGEFTDYRVSLIYTHIFSSKVRDLVRVEYKRDFHFDFLDQRKIFLSGFHLSGGLLSDFPNHGYSLGGGVWLKSPWLPFFGFFPSHTYGVSYRFNSFFTGKTFQEISLGVTSAFTF